MRLWLDDLAVIIDEDIALLEVYALLELNAVNLRCLKMLKVVMDLFGASSPGLISVNAHDE